MKAWNYLSGWTSFSLPKNIQKRLYKFLLRKAIGQFLQNELDLENFDIGIMNGSVELRDLDLNLQTLNKLLNDTPFILEEGRVASIHATIPWTTFWSGDISLKIQGLHLALRPMKNKPRMDESFASTPATEEPIMSSSLHFADDFLKSEIGGDQTQELHESIQKSFNTDTEDVDMEGLQVLTKVIDKMLAKIKIDIVDTVIRVIHKSAVPLVPGDEREYHLDICIPRISYFDETPEFNSSNVTVEPPVEENLMESSILLPPTANETIKFITMTSPEIWLRSSPQPNTLANSSISIYSLPTQSETTINEGYEDLSQTEFFDTEGGTSSIFNQQDDMTGSITPKAFRQQPTTTKPYEALLFATMNKRNHVRMKLRPSFDDTSLLPIKQIDFLVTHMRATITPLQVAFFLDLLDAMSSTDSTQLPPQPNYTQSYMSTATTNPILDDLELFQTNIPYTPFDIPSHPSYSTTTKPERKIKIMMSLIELYMLADDEPVVDWNHPQEGKGHIRFAIEQSNVRIQQFAQGSSTIDLKISNIALSEWIKKPSFVQQQFGLEDRSRTKYEVYNPILEFDNRIKCNYHDEDMFPSYDPSVSVNEERQSEVVRVRIERKAISERSRVDDAVAMDEDINVDVQAFKLLVDPRIVDRFDNYILAVNALQKRKEEENQFSFTNTTPKLERRPSVFDDLHSEDTESKRKIRVRFAVIRLVLFVPDMSRTSTREEFNDRFHKDQLSIDIKKLVGTWSLTDQNPVIDEESTGFVSPDKKPMKIHIEINYVNVFMHAKNDKLARTWFTAKTIQDMKYLSDETLCPKIEITIQDPNVIYPTKARQSVYFGSGSEIPTTLFDFLSRNEEFDGEQKLHVPMEEQSESSTLFKQTTVETSIISVNCHFPQTRMSLTKSLWDKVQIVQNDLLLWQPRFLISKQQNEDMSVSSHQTSSMLSQSQERLARPPQFSSQTSDQPQQKTLVSIVALLSSGIWDIRTSEANCYRLNFSEFKYFAAMKHLGQNENITTLDIEELTLTDISDPLSPILLLYKTIPKTIRLKKDTAMVSLFSRLTSYPDANRLDKVTSIVACNICWKATPNIEFINQLVDFQKVPQDMVFIDPPTQYIKVFAHVLETSIDYAPVNSPSRAAVVLDGVQVITDILAGQPFIKIKTCIQNIELWMIDDAKEMTSHEQLNGKTADARKYWSSMGLVNLLALLNIEVQVKVKLDEHAVGPQLDVSLVSTDIHMDSNTDSFQTLLNFITFCTNNGDRVQAPSPPADERKKKPSTRRTTTPHQIITKNDLLASLDENAFRTSPTSSEKISPPTFIEAPDMEDFNYVEEFYKSSPETAISSSSILINPSRPPRKPRRKQHQQRSKPSEDIIRVLLSPEEQNSDSLTVVDDYFGAEKKVEVPNSAVDTDKAILSLRVEQVNFIWKLYDGYAWKYIRSDMASKQQDGFSPEDAELNLQKDALMEIKLDSVSVKFDLMPDHDVTALYSHLLIKDVEIIDNIKTSTWKKFLGYMRPPLKEKPREVDACMVDIELISLRPVQDDPQQEFRLKVKMLPIRLYVDHDALNFLVKFFTFEKSRLKSTNAANDSIPKEDTEHDEEEEAATGIFFQYVDIFPITLKVDYKPKYINYGNIKEGQLAELVNLFHLDGAEMSLTHVKLTGIKGVDNLLERLGQEWLPHIKNTQVTNMVSGVSPIRSIVNLSNGVADLVLLPIQQYRKDGRIIKGIQRGTTSFARATAIEAIKLSSRVATGTQVILEHADGFFSPPSSSSSSNQMLQDQHFVYSDIYGVDINAHEDQEEEKKKKEDKRPALATEISDGFQFAYQNLSKNLGSAAQTIFAVPTEIAVQDAEGYTEAGGSASSSSGNGKSVIRAVPVAVIKPMIGLTGAFQTILTGLRNSIDPVMRLQSEDKYKKRK